MSRYETLKQAGYRHVGMLGDAGHVLYAPASHTYELFFKNKNHASWGIRYKNTHLEFLRSIDESELPEYMHQHRYCPRCIEDWEAEDGTQHKGEKKPSVCTECGICADCEHLLECKHSQ